MKEKINQLLNFIKENWFKLIISFTIFLIGVSFFYSYTLRPILNKPKLDKCLDNAKEEASKIWREYCKIDNRNIGIDGSCLLSSDRADDIKERNDKIKEECFKKYPQK